MKTNLADLHIHSKYSDGTYRPGEIFRIAKKSGYKAISITDHDCVDVFVEAFELSKNYGIEFIPGIELSSDYEEYDIHILGYFIDGDNQNLKKHLKEFCDVRVIRAKKMIELLNEGGIDINFDEILKISPEGSIARPHLAQLLIEKGYAYSIQDAFIKYLNTESKYYVKKYKISPSEAINLIHSSGGLAFAAHPLYLKNDPGLIKILMKDGLDGIETIHSSYDEDFLKFTENLATENKLLRSGGSDCHGKRKTGKKLMGQYHIPYSFISAMKDKLNGVKR